MQLFVIRHAIAHDAAPGQPDAERALTEDGEAKAKRVVRGLRALELRFDHVLTSPWRRATQTARLLAPIARTEPVETDLLTQPPRADLLGMIAGRQDIAAVVGHEPWLGELVAWLAFGDSKYGDAILIKKAGVLWLEGSAVPGGMQIRASLPPKLLRALA